MEWGGEMWRNGTSKERGGGDLKLLDMLCMGAVLACRTEHSSLQPEGVHRPRPLRLQPTFPHPAQRNVRTTTSWLTKVSF